MPTPGGSGIPRHKAPEKPSDAVAKFRRVAEDRLQNVILPNQKRYLAEEDQRTNGARRSWSAPLDEAAVVGPAAGSSILLGESMDRASAALPAKRAGVTSGLLNSLKRVLIGAPPLAATSHAARRPSGMSTASASSIEKDESIPTTDNAKPRRRKHAHGLENASTLQKERRDRSRSGLSTDGVPTVPAGPADSPETVNFRKRGKASEAGTLFNAFDAPTRVAAEMISPPDQRKLPLFRAKPSGRPRNDSGFPGVGDSKAADKTAERTQETDSGSDDEGSVVVRSEEDDADSAESPGRKHVQSMPAPLLSHSSKLSLSKAKADALGNLSTVAELETESDNEEGHVKFQGISARNTRMEPVKSSLKASSTKVSRREAEETGQPSSDSSVAAFDHEKDLLDRPHPSLAATVKKIRISDDVVTHSHRRASPEKSSKSYKHSATRAPAAEGAGSSEPRVESPPSGLLPGQVLLLERLDEQGRELESLRKHADELRLSIEQRSASIDSRVSALQASLPQWRGDIESWFVTFEADMSRRRDEEVHQHETRLRTAILRKADKKGDEIRSKLNSLSSKLRDLENDSLKELATRTGSSLLAYAWNGLILILSGLAVFLGPLFIVVTSFRDRCRSVARAEDRIRPAAHHTAPDEDLREDRYIEMPAKDKRSFLKSDPMQSLAPMRRQRSNSDQVHRHTDDDMLVASRSATRDMQRKLSTASDDAMAAEADVTHGSTLENAGSRRK